MRISLALHGAIRVPVARVVRRSPRGSDGVRGAPTRGNIGTTVDKAMDITDTIPPGSVGNA